jgi:GNAT superfamily N-acetyltransferase
VVAGLAESDDAAISLLALRGADNLLSVRRWSAGRRDKEGVVEQTSQGISIRTLDEGGLPEASSILRRAFATHFGTTPDTFWIDRDFVTGRWMTDPSLAFGAWIEDCFVGSSLGANWGSLGVFGPISTHPDTWNRGAARYLIPPVLERLSALGARHMALFTFAESTKHLALYQKFGFWPRFLAAIMTRSVAGGDTLIESTRFSIVVGAEQANWLAACRELTTEVRDGLDLTAELRTAQSHGHGDTVFLTEGSRVDAVAHCEYGPKSPAGAGSCLVRFAAVRPGPACEMRFAQLLNACDRLAANEGLKQVVACVNASRPKAYRHLLSMGFSVQRHGVTMHRPNEDAYNHTASYILDDLR